MAYQTQPGTFPHRVVQFLRTKAAGFEISTADLAEALDFDHNAVRVCLVNARKHGVLAVRKVNNPACGLMLMWRLGDGRPEQPDEAVASHDAQVEGVPIRRYKPVPKPDFRALEWDGRLLVTGMEIRDGVAIFEPHQILQLKRTTDWWRASA